MPRANSARTPAARRRGSSGARAAARRRDLCRSSRGPGHLPVPARTGGSYPSQPKTRPLQQRGASETAAAARSHSSPHPISSDARHPTWPDSMYSHARVRVSALLRA